MNPQAVEPMQVGAHPLPLEHGHLMSKREHFEGGIAATANENTGRQGVRGQRTPRINPFAMLPLWGRADRKLLNSHYGEGLATDREMIRSTEATLLQ